jgi:hypothetical protein
MQSRSKPGAGPHRERIQRQARICVRNGWSVIPVPHGCKGPKIRQWPRLRLTVEQLGDAFNDDDNLGLLLGNASRGLIDVDLDTVQALRAAKYFLPDTGRVHGRPGKPSSHYWYFSVPTLETMKFRDSDGTVIAEVRSTGQQTLIPPSLHPSGERYRWEKTDEPTHIEGPILLNVVSRLAACALLARHWPTRGSRHEVPLALCGFLLRNGWLSDEVEKFITAAAFACGTDEEWELRQRDVESTLRRFIENKSITGTPKLVSLLGEGVVAKMEEWLGFAPQNITKLQRAATPTWPNPLSDDAFYGLAGKLVSIVGPHSEADPAALLLQFLVAFGNVIGRSAYLQVEADKHFTNLFLVLVGPTSKARKGSALSHVKRVFSEADSPWANNCIVAGLSSGEGLIWAVRDLICSKDGEKVVDVGVDDKRLLAAESEFAQQLKLMTREGNILSTVLRQAWDAGNLRTLTKNNPAQATGVHIALIGHITVQELRRHLNQTESANGFGNRFLWACVKRSKLLPDGGRLNEDEVFQFVEQLRSTIEWARRIKRVQRSNKAKILWRSVYPSLSEGSAGILGAITSRAEAQVTRLSLIYALLDRSPRIKTRHLKAGLAVWQYALESAKFIFGDSLGDAIADEIVRALRVNATGLTRTEISHLFGGHRKSADIARALVVLAQAGLATCRPEETGGRPDERWFVSGEDAKNAKKE